MSAFRSGHLHKPIWNLRDGRFQKRISSLSVLGALLDDGTNCSPTAPVHRVVVGQGSRLDLRRGLSFLLAGDRRGIRNIRRGRVDGSVAACIVDHAAVVVLNGEQIAHRLVLVWLLGKRVFARESDG